MYISLHLVRTAKEMALRSVLGSRAINTFVHCVYSCYAASSFVVR